MRTMRSSFETPGRNAIGIAAAIILLATSATIAYALNESPAGGAAVAATPAAPSPPVPDKMKVVPSDEGEAAPAPPSSESSAKGAPAAKPVKHRARHHAAVAAEPPEVEPVPPGTRLKVKSDGWIYAAPSKSSKHLEKATIGKFVNVSGSTKHFLQAQLKDGQTGYISPDDVELTKSVDKVFILTQDAVVLDAPNRWGKKLAEVHRTHSVHVVGLALNYMRIRMKSGLEGYIPATALQ
jgi:hypothetical protein